jgi:WD40 repeat protein
MAYIA